MPNEIAEKGEEPFEGNKEKNAIVMEKKPTRDCLININEKDETVVMYNDAPGRYYAYDQQGGYGQTPYYQQRVGGQPVYVQEPADASRMPAYRPRDARYYQPNVPPPPQAQGGFNPPPDDDSNLGIFRSNFNDRSIRNRFVQRVYTILSIQILYTTAFICMCMFVPPIKSFVSRDIIGFLIALVVSMVIYFVLVCVISTRRTVPLNFVLLALFTIAEAYVFSVISTHYQTRIVFTSMGITAVVCLVVSVLACTVCCDVTGCGMFLCAASIIVMLFGFVAILLTLFLNMKIMFLIYAALVALLFSMYLIYDTQQIIGGRRIELSEEEYICGALTLYVDIMQIFWAILTLCGFSQN